MTEVARLLLRASARTRLTSVRTTDGLSEEPRRAAGRVSEPARQWLRKAWRSAWRPSIPPHNAAELCDAALFLIDNPTARSKTLLKFVPGPDFPTGGIVVDSKDRLPRP